MSKFESIKRQDNNYFRGIDINELVSNFKTPLYLLDGEKIRENLKIYKDSLSAFGENVLVLYASKAMCCKAICNIMKEENVGLDVVTGGELYTALAIDFPKEKIFFHGNNKMLDELELAIKSKIGFIVVDNLNELNLINKISEKYQQKTKILIRVKTGVEAHTHEYIRTGGIDSKFGFILQNGEAFNAVKEARILQNIKFVGIHSHIGSQIFDVEPFILACQRMMEFACEIKEKIGVEIEELNLGGGFGICYTEEDTEIDYKKFINYIVNKIKELSKTFGIKPFRLLLEPGRSIVANAGATIYEVGVIKEIPGKKTYIIIDGGMTDNPRYALYKSKYEFLNLSNNSQEIDGKFKVVGRCCESGDIIGDDVSLPETKVGDLIAVLGTGAYNYSMASNYNRMLKPSVVLVENKIAREIVKRETYEDIIRNDI